MSKLTDFYAHKAAIDEQDPRWEQMEDQLLKEELLPELAEQLKSLLSKVKSPLMFSGFYDPNGGLSLSFTRNCIQSSLQALAKASTEPTEEGNQYEVTAEKVDVPEQEEEAEIVEAGTEITEPKRKKAKSIGFSVSFRDGVVFHEHEAVDTWIKALRKIGLENICNNRSKHRAWHRVDGQDICIVERTETIRKSGGTSPQKFIDGFYVMTNMSNGQKVNDLMALAEFMPKLGITVTWDNESEETTPAEELNNPQRKRGRKPRQIDFGDNTALIERFQRYVGQHNDPRTAKSYTSILNTGVREWISRVVDENADSVFGYTNIEDLKTCIDLLMEDKDFVEENDRKHNPYTAALKKYLKFRIEEENG